MTPRYSNRFVWELRTNRLARLLEAKRQSGAALLDLTESNPTTAGFSYSAAELQRAFANDRWLTYEPAAAGLAAAREAVAGVCYQHAVAPERILLTASTSEAYSYLFKLLTDPGDEVLVPRPSYPLFEFLAGLEAARPVPYSLGYHGEWRIDFHSLRAAISPRTRAVIIVNPNNPTGSFLKADERGELMELCAEQGLALISDEVFSGYLFEDRPAANLVRTVCDETTALTFCLGGLSKMAGLPQMKAGWIAVAGPAAAQREALTRLELIADTYLSVSSPVQHALPGLLIAGVEVRKQIGERVNGNMEYLKMALPANSPARLLDAEGGWYAVLEVPRIRGEEEWALELLEHDNVIVQPGYFYDFEREAFLVLSLLTPREIFRQGVQRLLARLGS